MLAGAGAGLGITSLVLLLTTMLTFQIEFNEQAVAFVAYVMLVYGMAFGAAVALLTRPRMKEESDAQASGGAFSERHADRVLRLVGGSDDQAQPDPRILGDSSSVSDREADAGAEDVLGVAVAHPQVDEGIARAMDAVAKARLHRASE